MAALVSDLTTPSGGRASQTSFDAALPDDSTTSTISSGVSSTGLYVSHGETLTVLSGGLVSRTDVQGQEVISHGGSAVGDIINGAFTGGGSQDVMGFASDTTLHSGATQSIGEGGLAINTKVGSDSVLIVGAGGSANDLALEHLGDALVDAGGAVSGAIISFGALSISGAAQNTIIDGGTVTVQAGGSANGTAVRGDLQVSSGGHATDTTVDVRLDVYTSGSEAGAHVHSGGTVVAWGGNTDADVVESGGNYEIVSATVSALIVESASILTIAQPGLTLAGLVARAGADIVVSTTSAAATVSNGVLTITASGGATYATATLADDGRGLSFDVISRTKSSTEFVVVSGGDAPAARLAQSLAGFGGGGAIAGSGGAHSGVSSALFQVARPSQGL